MVFIANNAKPFESETERCINIYQIGQYEIMVIGLVSIFRYIKNIMYSFYHFETREWGSHLVLISPFFIQYLINFILQKQAPSTKENMKPFTLRRESTKLGMCNIYAIMQIEYIFHPRLKGNSYDYFNIGQVAIIKII